MKFNILVTVSIILIISLVSCSNAQQESTGTLENIQNTAPTISVSPDLASVKGTIVTKYSGEPKPMGNTIIRLAQVFNRSEDDEGTFILDGANSPGAISEQDGTFVVLDIEPGDYVLVVGDVMQDHEIVLEPDGKAKVFTAEQGKVSDFGVIEVFLKP